MNCSYEKWMLFDTESILKKGGSQWRLCLDPIFGKTIFLLTPFSLTFSFSPSTHYVKNHFQKWNPNKDYVFLVCVFVLVWTIFYFVCVVELVTNSFFLIRFINYQCRKVIGGHATLKCICRRRENIDCCLLVNSDLFLLIYNWYSWVSDLIFVSKKAYQISNGGLLY